MCLIIDTCAFHAVFNETDKNHFNFVAIVDWLENRRGKIVIGGSKYRKEIETKKVTRLLRNFDQAGRLVKVNDAKVDQIAADLKKRVPEKEFDDEHLVAIISVSRCIVICTNEKRAIPYLKRRDLYPNGVSRPKIYRTMRNADLCCEEHIVDCCRRRVGDGS